VVVHAPSRIVIFDVTDTFCSQGCKATFGKSPEKYAAR
jgi:hypothetical protein